KTIYETVVEMFDRKQAIDIITVQQILRDRQQLESVGGVAHLASLPDAVPSAANLGYYVDIVLEKHSLRRLIGTCTDVVGRAYEHQGEVDEFLAATRAGFERLLRPSVGIEEELRARMFDLAHPPPPEHTVYYLQNVPVCTSGNLSTITAALKS